MLHEKKIFDTKKLSFSKPDFHDQNISIELRLEINFYVSQSPDVPSRGAIIP